MGDMEGYHHIIYILGPAPIIVHLEFLLNCHLIVIYLPADAVSEFDIVTKGIMTACAAAACGAIG